MPAARLAFSYLAFSTAQQSEGRSTDRQHRAAENWCEENGFRLAPSRQYCDLGVSRYNGRARMKGDLSRFLKLCGTPAVPAGSVFIVEDFDRLSRENADDAWELFRGILLAEVEIVVLSLGRWFKKDSLRKFEDRLLVQACQHRAHQESATKAMRLRDIWVSRRKKAAAGEDAHTNLPMWVRRGGSGDLELVPERADDVRDMVRWTLEGRGMGCTRIARRLSKGPDARPCWLRGGVWDAEAVRHILRSEYLWGAYQPKRLDDRRKFVPTGEVVRDHYPAVVSEDVAARVRRAMTARRKDRGRRADHEANVLRYVARCAETGTYLRLHGYGTTGRPKQLNRRYNGQVQTVIPYDTLEEIVLGAVNEWTTDALAEPRADDEDALGQVVGDLRRLEADRAAITEELHKPGRAASTVAILAGQLDELAAREGELQDALAQHESGRPVAAALEASQAIIRRMAGLSGDALVAARGRLNEHLRDLLEGVWVYRHRWSVKNGEVVVQAWSRSGQMKQRRVIVGVPPEGWVPLDVRGADFRGGYPARLTPRKGGGKK